MATSLTFSNMDDTRGPNASLFLGEVVGYLPTTGEVVQIETDAWGIREAVEVHQIVFDPKIAVWVEQGTTFLFWPKVRNQVINRRSEGYATGILTQETNQRGYEQYALVTEGNKKLDKARGVATLVTQDEADARRAYMEQDLIAQAEEVAS